MVLAFFVAALGLEVCAVTATAPVGVLSAHGAPDALLQRGRDRGGMEGRATKGTVFFRNDKRGGGSR